MADSRPGSAGIPMRPWLTAALLGALVAGAAAADPVEPTQADNRMAVRASVTDVKTQTVRWPVRGTGGHVPRGPGCPTLSTSLAANFDSIDVGSEITMQAGMVQFEGFGHTYIVPDPNPATPQNEAFPIKVDLVEVITASLATISGSSGLPVRIGWAIDVYDGEPDTGSVVFTVESTDDPASFPDLPEDILIDRLSGSACQPCNSTNLQASVVKLQFSVDAGADPGDQIIVPGNANVGGVATGRFTVVFRIIAMNDNTPYGACTFGITNDCGPLNRCHNGFMCTESNSSGALNHPSRNWAVFRECGPFACAGGTYRFSQLSAGGGISSGCRPSRDVLMQVSYTPAVCTVATQGACCATDGSCTISEQGSCSGAYQGNGAVCSPNPCPQPATGACCNNGVCDVRTQSSCVSAGGVFQGAGVTCGSVSCGASGGACCSTASSACFPLTAAQCAGIGIYQGNGTTCTAGFECPTGACCNPSTGACAAGFTPLTCASQVGGGVWQGQGTACSPNPCPVPSGACCFASGACLVGSATQCAGFPNTTFIGGGACSPNPCPQPGVCCRGTTCAIGVTQQGCTAPTGVGAAYVTAGACNAQGNSTSPCCYADFNKASGIEVQDIFDYLNAWFTSSPYTDVGGNGTTTSDTQDIFDYLNAWFTGGC